MTERARLPHVHTQSTQVYSGRLALRMALALLQCESMWQEAHLAPDLRTFTVRWRADAPKGAK